MGQTASNLDDGNPTIEEFQYSKNNRLSTTVPKTDSNKSTHEDKIDRGQDEIDEDQAREDLIAYIKIVGENSTNLPLTWRDDPEFHRIISNLTSREYAMKSDAFIPCDVRIIGSTSLTDSRKTLKNISRNIDASHRDNSRAALIGGAVSNSLLTALYDFENETNLDEEGSFDEDILFEEDRSKSIDSIKFTSSDNKTLTWSNLIRQMKDVMEEQGYHQIPILTTSRKFNLDEPVHLLPPDFDPKCNRKFALLVGCSYKGRHGELKHSHNDVKITRDYIVNVHGFPDEPSYMNVLMDDGLHQKPTANNIIRTMRDIALRSRPGDAVFIQFVGHGGRVMERLAEGEGYEEFFAPVDYRNRGLISEKTLFRSLLCRMAEDVTVTILADGCGTGMVFDMPYSWETHQDSHDVPAKLSINENFSFMRLVDTIRQTCNSSNMDDTIMLDLEYSLRDAAIEAEVNVNNNSKISKMMRSDTIPVNKNRTRSMDSVDYRSESDLDDIQSSYESSWGSSYDSY